MASLEALLSAVKDAPPTTEKLLRTVIRKENAGARAMFERAEEFGSPLTAVLSGVLAHPDSRKVLDEALDEAWSKNGVPREFVPEVVVGAGLHAAIYTAIRVAQGAKPPLVLEATDRVGGAFAVSQSPSFYLNSRNRPGGQGFPGSGGSLNYLPGLPVQPHFLGSAEYLTNADLAGPIRIGLAMNAKVVTGARVKAIEQFATGRRDYIVRMDGRSIKTGRVIVAQGLGQEPKAVFGKLPDSPRILSFFDLMRSMDEPFPLRGMDRVAVIGVGDSGKTAVESLLGHGPGRHMSVSGLDYPSRIDWYGFPAGMDENTWCMNQRPRYRNLGRFFRPGVGGARLRPMESVTSVLSGYDVVYVNERPYSHVVLCVGQTTGDPLTTPGKWEIVFCAEDGRILCQRFTDGLRKDVFLIGPGANIGVTALEQQAAPALADIPENATAIFRYAQRTAQLAAVIEKLSLRR